MPPDLPGLSHNEALDVLIVENDPAMARLTYEAFRLAGLHHQVQTLPDGEEALAYLRRTAPHASAPHPDLICLDLHLPRTSGLEVLEELKRDPKLRLTPVIVISGSDNPDEVRRAYELHASCFIRKPDDLDQFLRFVQVCFEFWGTFVTLPTKPELLGQPAAN
jgi:CheY-like chemotaxis protein